jgi:3-oxoacyl-[acyl-carrier-protein] synthase III
MRYERVCLESFGYALPVERVSSEEIERRLGAVYQRLRLPEGRLELMTGIRERRIWRQNAPPGAISMQSARLALEAADIDPAEIGLLVHGSVCRDRLEPATACRVHHHLGLAPHCQIFDLSNACLGLMNGLVLIASLIEAGQIRAGLVVGAESSRNLMENTIDQINGDETLTRQSIKSQIASLTIGSASCAMLLVHESLSRTGNRLESTTIRCRTEHHGLCESAEGSGMQEIMSTDSEQLLREGVAVGAETFEHFLADGGFQRSDFDHTFCHQVGVAHRKLLLDTLKLPLENDHTTFEWLGNTGSAALPVTAAIHLEKGAVQPGQRFAMLGIGSGINSVMASVRWQTPRIRGVEIEG